MTDLDPTDPLIAALGSLAEPLMTPPPPIDAIVRRAARRRASRGRVTTRSATAAALVLLAGSIAVAVNRGDDDGVVDVQTVTVDTFGRPPVPDAGATGPSEIGRRRFAGSDVVVTVEPPVDTQGVSPDYRAGRFGPFGADRRFHRPDECVPAGEPDALYTVSLASSGRMVEINTDWRPLPLVLDLTPVQVYGLDADEPMTDWNYRAVLVLTDRSPLTYTATFADGSTDEATSDDPAVALFGSRVPGLNAPTPGVIEPGLTKVIATDEAGDEVWTATSADPYPWFTAEGCNGVEPESIGVAASADVAAAANELAAALPQFDATGVEAIVDDAPPAFAAPVEELRRTAFSGATIEASAQAVRMTANGETWALLASTSPYLDHAWVQLVLTPNGWRMTRQSLCAMVPEGMAVDSCGDVMAGFDPDDPT